MRLEQDRTFENILPMIDAKPEASTNHETALAATVAPEDLHCGDYVSLLNEVFEYPTWLWNSDAQVAPGSEFVRVQLPASDAGTPLKVKAICLPFVLMKTPKGKHRKVDVRSCQLVRLSLGYAKRAWNAMKKRKPKKASRTA